MAQTASSAPVPGPDRTSTVVVIALVLLAALGIATVFGDPIAAALSPPSEPAASPGPGPRAPGP